MLDRAFAGEIAYSEIEETWATQSLQGSFQKCSLLMHALLGEVVLKFKQPESEIVEAIEPAVKPTPTLKDLDDFEAIGQGRDAIQLEKTSQESATPTNEQTSPLARAIALLVDAQRKGKSYSVRDLASMVGCGKDKLYRDPGFRTAWKAFTAGPGIPKGSKDAEGIVEAVHEEDEETEAY